jgi:hypothetical protein
MAIALSRMIISAEDLNREDVIFVELRNQVIVDQCRQKFQVNHTFFSRCFRKFIGRDLEGLKIRRNIELMAENFTVYAHWDCPEALELYKSQFCKTKCYFEEGFLTYNNSLKLEECWIGNNKQSTLNDSKRRYDLSASFFFGWTKESFPLAPSGRRVILTNFEDALTGYRSGLSSNDSIGLLPRRLKRSHLLAALDRLVDNMDGPGKIKIHPEDYGNAKLKLAVIKYLNTKTDLISLAPMDLIIELELLIQPRKVIGWRSSSSLYTHLFGSTYICLDAVS